MLLARHGGISDACRGLLTDVGTFRQSGLGVLILLLIDLLVGIWPITCM